VYPPVIASANGIWQGLAFRSTQLLVPPLLFLAAVLVQWRRTGRTDAYGSTRQRLLLIGPIPIIFGTYVLLKAGYNFMNVNFWHQGHWYFACSILVTNKVLLDTFATNPERTGSPRRSSGFFASSAIAAVLLAIVLGNAFVDGKKRTSYNMPYYAVWAQRDQLSANIAAHLGSNGSHLIEFDDGIVTYALAQGGLSGLGFAMDVEALHAKQSGRLLDLAYSRGYRYFTSLVYFRYSQSQVAEPNALDRLVRSAFFLSGQDLSKWNFKLAYFDLVTGMSFVEFSPKS
jgi:hypothetical protein